ncbi:MAG: hypothetical protein H7Y38_09880 [Armatimonadetes bacterium]|nr:hypothetical protein [Armatimonadota bacterium]
MKPEPPPSAPSTLMPNNSARRFVLAGLPLFLLAAWCFASVGARTAQHLLHPAESKTYAKSEAQARTIAASVLSGIAGESVAANRLEFSSQSAFSVRRNAAIQEWNVVADSGANRSYLLRINSRTKVVYGINRVSSVPLAVARPAQESPITPIEARQLAERYLASVLGTYPRHALQWDNTGATQTDTDSLNGDRGCFMFTYRYATGSGKRIVKIGIDRSSGNLSYYWNPSGVI